MRNKTKYPISVKCEYADTNGKILAMRRKNDFSDTNHSCAIPMERKEYQDFKWVEKLRERRDEELNLNFGNEGNKIILGYETNRLRLLPGKEYAFEIETAPAFERRSAFPWEKYQFQIGWKVSGEGYRNSPITTCNFDWEGVTNDHLQLGYTLRDATIDAMNEKDDKHTNEKDQTKQQFEAQEGNKQRNSARQRSNQTRKDWKEYEAEKKTELEGNVLKKIGLQTILWQSREFVIEAVKLSKLGLKYASKALKGDKEVVLQAVKSHSFAIKFASKALKDDKEVVLQVFRGPDVDVDVLKHIGWNMRDDDDVMLEAVKLEGKYAMRYASKRLQDAPTEAMEEAIKAMEEAIKKAM